MTAAPEALSGRVLYLCTPDRPDLSAFVAACVAGGVDLVQLRDKTLEARRLIERATKLCRLCTELDVPFILNDRPDLALEVEADGVHLGQDDAPPALARRILGQGAIIGLSTHSEANLQGAMSEAEAGTIDYLSAGPVVPTPTKPGRPATGESYAVAATGASTLPVFVTGGVDPRRARELVQAGARRFVAVRWLTEAADPESAARALRGAIDEALAATA